MQRRRRNCLCITCSFQLGCLALSPAQQRWLITFCGRKYCNSDDDDKTFTTVLKRSDMDYHDEMIKGLYMEKALCETKYRRQEFSVVQLGIINFAFYYLFLLTYT